MAAATADRNTTERAGDVFSDPVKAATKIYAGTILCLDAAGNAQPGATALGLIVRGRAEEQVDNSAGIAGALSITSHRGVFPFANSAAGDAITRAEIGDDCYIVDDSTVAKTSGGATRSVAGKIIDVDAAGVWVRLGF
ncbi:MAG: hypothetical protein ABIO43_12810 [Sphingomicrobium sp.]